MDVSVALSGGSTRLMHSDDEAEGCLFFSESRPDSSLSSWSVGVVFLTFDFEKIFMTRQ